MHAIYVSLSVYWRSKGVAGRLEVAPLVLDGLLDEGLPAVLVSVVSAVGFGVKGIRMEGELGTEGGGEGEGGGRITG